MEKTCGNCLSLEYAPRCRRLGWIDIEDNDTPDDDGNSFADICIYHQETREPSLEQRYQQLAEVTREMHRTMREWYEALPTEDSPNPVPFWTRLNEQLEELGVEL